jgi:SAM-dependent methyltransferase
MIVLPRRVRRARNHLALRRGRPADYHFFHADAAACRLDPRGRDVLVVGANTGAECRLFVEFGAGSVHGIDVADDLGAAFRHPRVAYTRMSVEELTFPDASFDLVYTFATMEHVHGLEAAFAGMARVTRPGGVVYSHASPLWHSPFGHHKGDLFPDDPWIHLLRSETEILEHARALGLPDAEHHVRYMLNPAYFGMRAAGDYVRACAEPPGMDVEVNAIEQTDAALLTPDLERELGARGISRFEALGQSHTFVAIKRPHRAGRSPGT